MAACVDPTVHIYNINATSIGEVIVLEVLMLNYDSNPPALFD